jgi:hypothetical protein
MQGKKVKIQITCAAAQIIGGTDPVRLWALKWKYLVKCFTSDLPEALVSLINLVHSHGA